MREEEERIERLANNFETFCPAVEDLVSPGGFRDSGLAVVSSVFSIRANDSSVRAAVDSFAKYFNLEVAPLNPSGSEEDQYPVERLAQDLFGFTETELCATVFQNSATSPSVGVPKAVLVAAVAPRLVKAGVRVRSHVAMQREDPRYNDQKRAWVDVDGLGWVTFEYFRLLCGAETSKPDVMVHRWLTSVLDETLSDADAVATVTSLSEELGRRWGTTVSSRAVDHMIWRKESGREGGE